MKPKNFPYRKLRRLARIYAREFKDGILQRQSRLMFYHLYGKVNLRSGQIPKDIRIRLGRSGWLDAIQKENTP